MALKSSDIKYALLTSEIDQYFQKTYFMCHLPCCFIQLPFQTSICSPHNDIVYLLIIVMALKSSDIKYALQMCEICNTHKPPYFMCIKQCFFIQLPFQTSICSPHNDIINIFYVSSLYVRKMKMSDMKYALQMCEICITLLSSYFMCHKQC